MGRRGRPGFGAARCPLIISLLLCAVARAQDGEDGGNTGPQCSEDRLDLCDDLCTLDGKRPNPCPLECNVQTGDCYDRCVNPIEDGALPYDVNDAIINDAFDPVCANRLRKRIAESLVTDSFESTLRDPPAVSSGLSSVPFSMFRNGLLHTGRSDHRGPSVTVAGVPTIGWTYKTGGRIFSSPTLASDGTVYVGCTDGFVYGVQRSGVIKWKYPAGGPVVSTAAIGNPIGSDTTLFMGGADGTLHAVSANYGTSKWEYIRPRLHLNGKWQLKATRPIVSSAALAPEGIVYIGADTALYAINAATGSGGFSGTVKWSYETRGLILGSPALDGAGRIYVGTMEGALYCLRQDDGEFIWRFDAEGGLYSSPGVGRRRKGIRRKRGLVPLRARRPDRRAPLEVPHVRGDILLPGGVRAGSHVGARVRLRREHGLEAVRGESQRRVVGVEPDATGLRRAVELSAARCAAAPRAARAAGERRRAAAATAAARSRRGNGRRLTCRRRRGRWRRRSPSWRRKGCARRTWSRGRARRRRVASGGTPRSRAGRRGVPRLGWCRRRSSDRTASCTSGALTDTFTRSTT